MSILAVCEVRPERMVVEPRATTTETSNLMKPESASPHDLCLELDSNPPSVFYKDEGGKSNFLSASCMIKFRDEVKTVPIGNMRILPRLVYENGAEIEDEEDIFNILSVDPKTVTATNEIFTVKFRIEKVSRRKDGRKFRVKFVFNEVNSQLLDYVSAKSLSPVETTAITVLSKRKSHTIPFNGSSLVPGDSKGIKAIPKASPQSVPKSRVRNLSRVEENLRNRISSIDLDRSDEKPARRKKARNNNQKDAITLPVNFLLKIKENMLRLESRVLALTERVATLESNKCQSSPLPGITRHHRVHSLMFEDAFDGFASENNDGSNSCTAAAETERGAIKRNGSSTQELFEFLASSQVLS